MALIDVSYSSGEDVRSRSVFVLIAGVPDKREVAVYGDDQHVDSIQRYGLKRPRKLWALLKTCIFTVRNIYINLI